jgi:hypothetical protein
MQLTYQYEHNIDTTFKVIVRVPAMSDMLYESIYESQVHSFKCPSCHIFVDTEGFSLLYCKLFVISCGWSLIKIND